MGKRALLLFFAAFAPLTADTLRGRVALSFTPGFLTSQKSIAYGVAGEFEIYDAPTLGLAALGRVSLRGDLYGFMAQSPAARTQQNYQGFFGIVFNFSDMRGLVPYFGFQPGFGLIQVDGAGSTLYLYPSLSPFFGLHYFFGTQFHITANLRYVFGELGYASTGAVYLSEARATLGLGTSW